MRVLGIETSCDETGVAVYDTGRRACARTRCYSQIALHADYGGVVPELASRDHVRKLLPLVRQTLAEAGLARRATSTAWPIPPARAWSAPCWSGAGRRPRPGLGAGHPGDRRAPHGRPPAGARCWRTRPAGAALRGPAGLRRPHPAGRGRRHRPLPPARRDPGRRRRRGLRQDRQAHGPALSRRARSWPRWPKAAARRASSSRAR